MEEKLNEYLREGARVRWQSQPENFPLLDNGSRMQILRKWILTVIIAGGLLISYISAQQSPGMGFIIVVLLGAAGMLLSPVMEKRSILKSRYWITDQRVIQMTKDKVFYYMNLEDVDAFEVVKDMTAKDCLVVGTPVFQDAKKYIRWRADRPKEDPEAMKDRDHVDGMILYNIGNAEAGAALLKELGCARVA